MPHAFWTHGSPVTTHSADSNFLTTLKSVSWFHMTFFCWHSCLVLMATALETWVNTQPHTALWTLEFCSCFSVFSAKHTHIIQFSCLPKTSVCCVFCLLVWVWAILAISCIRSHTNIIQTSWLGMVTSRGWKNRSFVHFQGYLLME